MVCESKEYLLDLEGSCASRGTARFPALLFLGMEGASESLGAFARCPVLVGCPEPGWRPHVSFHRQARNTHIDMEGNMGEAKPPCILGRLSQGQGEKS